MPTRFDHAVIVVRDLDAAIARFQHLGFDARPGGRHTGRGSHNGLIRFGLDYIELLSVYDEAEARAYSHDGQTLVDKLDGKEASLFSYALATRAIEEDAQRFTGTGSVLPQPNPMSRTRPDGQKLSWRTLAPGGASWHRPWPFLIQWDTPDEQRLQIDLPGTHSNGAKGWVKIAIVTPDLAPVIDVYRNQLGLELLSQENDVELAAQRATFGIGDRRSEILAPEGKGPAQEILAEKGEGPFALSFAVQNLEQTRAFLQERNIQFTHIDHKTEQIILAPEETLNIIIRFVA